MGMVASLIYLVVVVGSAEADDVLIASIWLAVMIGAAISAWFADRMTPRTGRRMMWGAFAAFFVLGVLSVFSVGLLYLLAAVLSVFSLARSQTGGRVGTIDEP